MRKFVGEHVGFVEYDDKGELRLVHNTGRNSRSVSAPCPLLYCKVVLTKSTSECVKTFRYSSHTYTNDTHTYA